MDTSINMDLDRGDVFLHNPIPPAPPLPPSSNLMDPLGNASSSTTTSSYAPISHGITPSPLPMQSQPLVQQQPPLYQPIAVQQQPAVSSFVQQQQPQPQQFSAPLVNQQPPLLQQQQQQQPFVQQQQPFGQQPFVQQQQPPLVQQQAPMVQPIQAPVTMTPTPMVQTVVPQVPRRFLVCIDGGRFSDSVFEEGCRQCKAFQGQLVLFSVIESSTGGILGVGKGRTRSAEDDESRFRKLLDLYAQRCEQEGVPYEILLGTSRHPESLICDVARQYQISGIVLGHSRTSWAKRRLGTSLSHYMLEHADCNVIFARDTAWEKQQQVPLPVENAVHTTIGSPLSGGLPVQKITPLHHVQGIIQQQQQLNQYPTVNTPVQTLPRENVDIVV